MLIIEHSIKNLNTAYTKLISQYMLTEDRESKNMHKARRWIEQNRLDVIGKTLRNGGVVTP